MADTTPDSPEMPTNAEVQKTYLSIALVVTTLQKNWKTITAVLTVISALSSGVYKYVSHVSEIKSQQITMKVDIESLKTQLIALDHKFENCHVTYTTQNKK